VAVREEEYPAVAVVAASCSGQCHHQLIRHLEQVKDQVLVHHSQDLPELDLGEWKLACP